MQIHLLIPLALLVVAGANILSDFQDLTYDSKSRGLLMQDVCYGPVPAGWHGANTGRKEFFRVSSTKRSDLEACKWLSQQSHLPLSRDLPCDDSPIERNVSAYSHWCAFSKPTRARWGRGKGMGGEDRILGARAGSSHPTTRTEAAGLALGGSARVFRGNASQWSEGQTVTRLQGTTVLLQDQLNNVGHHSRDALFLARGNVISSTSVW